ncbi:hypothetical protein WJR50_26840 [Catalinimonas sp. 4WD22]|uniref:hypothetical protein n=1 Tax=Catalinimonas locisalis TaxID=3133978 RepID=UPI003101428A
MFKNIITLLIILIISLDLVAQSHIPGADNAVDDLPISFRLLGHLQTKSTFEIESSNWILGCETLDRDMADFDEYKEYLAPLGIKRLRLQAGWAKTEKVKGQYDWQWLDHIIDEAISRGCEPWLQTSYGNPIYSGGGGINLSAGMPTSAEALAAWDRWVEAMVIRYQDKVKEWEIWNEPNFGDNAINQPIDVAKLNIRTAEIIKRIQPEARISGLSMGHIDLAYADTFFKYIHEKGKMQLFDNMTYHDYVYNPDENYWHVAELRKVLDKYGPEVKLRQGENGCPSMGGAGRGALGDYPWSEFTQAKWNTRRMLGDLGHDMESSILGIIDMNYHLDGPITRLNVKGIIQSDSTMRAIRPKMAYYAMQHVASVFDHSLSRIKNVKPTFNTKATVNPREVKYNMNTDRSLAFYGYEHHNSNKQVYTLWMDENIPTESTETKDIQLTLIGARMDEAVYVDIITGKVYEIPKETFHKEEDKLIFERVPVYDAPILIIEKSLVSWK